MSKNYKKMFETLNEYLKNKIEDIDQTIIEAVNARNNGKCFSFQEHLKGFVYAQLSALVSWKNIKAHHTELDSLFCNFEKDRLKEIAPEILNRQFNKLYFAIEVSFEEIFIYFSNAISASLVQ